MSDSIEISVVIPAYNEELILVRHFASLIPVLNIVAGEQWEILVVDDGSTDQTAKVVANFGCAPQIRVIRSAANLGKGAALRLGVAASQGGMVLTCDADMSTPPETLIPFVAALKGGADIVIGNRRSPEAHIEKRQPWIRRFLGTGFLFLCQFLTGVKVQDFNCGFKLFRGSVAREVMAAATINGWAIDMESLALARCRHLCIVELPVDWSDSSRSAVRLSRDIPATLSEMLRVWWRLKSTSCKSSSSRPNNQFDDNKPLE